MGDGGNRKRKRTRTQNSLIDQDHLGRMGLSCDIVMTRTINSVALFKRHKCAYVHHIYYVLQHVITYVRTYVCMCENTCTRVGTYVRTHVHDNDQPQYMIAGPMIATYRTPMLNVHTCLIV